MDGRGGESILSGRHLPGETGRIHEQSIGTQNFRFAAYPLDDPLLNLTLATLLCWQFAKWTWLFLAPVPSKPVSTAAPDPAHLIDTIRAAHLFGTLWSGEGQDVSFTPPDGHVISLERLAWNIHPLGRLPVEVEFSGMAKVRERKNELEPIMRLLGKPDQNGFYALKL